MARKLFFSKRRKLPVFLQLYFAWVILAAIASIGIYFGGTFSKVNPEKPQASQKYYQAPFIANLLARAPKKSAYSIISQYVTKKRYAFRNLTILPQINKEKSCRSLGIKKPGSKKISLLVPYNLENSLAAVYTAIAFAEFANNAKKPLAIEILIYDAKADCQSLDQWLSKAQQDQLVILIQPHAMKKAKLNIIGESAVTSSPNWLNVFSDIEKDSFFNQVAISALPLFQSNVSIFLKQDFPAVQLNYSLKDKPLSYVETDKLANQLVQLSLNQAGNKAYNLENRSFWLSSTTALKQGAYYLVLVLGLILIWFPVANQLYLSNGKINPVESLIASIYFALVPFFTYMILSLSKNLFANTTLWVGVVIILAGTLFYIAIRIFKRILFFKVNVVSALVMLNIGLMVLALYNSALFLILTPLPIFFSRIKNSERIKGLFLLIVGLVPLIVFFWSAFDSQYQGQGLTPGFILKHTISNIGGGLLLSFIVGSILSLINRQASNLHGH